MTEGGRPKKKKARSASGTSACTSESELVEAGERGKAREKLGAGPRRACGGRKRAMMRTGLKRGGTGIRAGEYRWERRRERMKARKTKSNRYKIKKCRRNVLQQLCLSFLCPGFLCCNLEGNLLFGARLRMPGAAGAHNGLPGVRGPGPGGRETVARRARLVGMTSRTLAVVVGGALGWKIAVVHTL